MTLKVHSAKLPEESVTLNVLVVVPRGNVAPLGNPAVCTVVCPGQLSEPTGVV